MVTFLRPRRCSILSACWCFGRDIARKMDIISFDEDDESTTASEMKISVIEAKENIIEIFDRFNSITLLLCSIRSTKLF